jgi:acyl dehydratase
MSGNPADKNFDGYELGEDFYSPGRTVTETDVVNFAGLTGDWHYVHTDALAASKSQFGQRIAHGTLTFAIASGLMARMGIGSEHSIAFLAIRNWTFKAPVFLGDTIRVRVEVKDKHESRKLDRGVITFLCQVLIANRDDEVSSEGEWVQMYKRNA